LKNQLLTRAARAKTGVRQHFLNTLELPGTSRASLDPLPRRRGVIVPPARLILTG
jgi:hypothetical protein